MKNKKIIIGIAAVLALVVVGGFFYFTEKVVLEEELEGNIGSNAGSNIYMEEISYEELDESQRELIDEAEKAMETAYNPYSHFYAGAAILSQDGQIITGSNVENAIYGYAACADEVAILRAITRGIRKFEKIAIISRGEDFDTTEIAGPCGRQMLYEFAQISEKNIEVIMSTTKKDKIIVTTIEELLPLAFGPKELGVDIEKYQ